VVGEAPLRRALEHGRAQLHLVVRLLVVLAVLRLALLGRLQHGPDLDHSVLAGGGEVPAIEAEGQPPDGAAVLQLLGLAHTRLGPIVVVEAQLLRQEQLAQLARGLVLGLDLPVR
jgi:hypothetical protein